MKVSTKGRYGLRILLDIALHETGGKPRMIREIAVNQEISEKYISRLIIELRKAGFLKSVRGAKGGYTLMRKPEEIRILDVLEVMEGEIDIVVLRLPERAAAGSHCVPPGGCGRRSTGRYGMPLLLIRSGI